MIVYVNDSPERYPLSFMQQVLNVCENNGCGLQATLARIAINGRMHFFKKFASFKYFTAAKSFRVFPIGFIPLFTKSSITRTSLIVVEKLIDLYSQISRLKQHNHGDDCRP